MKKLLTIATLLVLTNSYIRSADWISTHLPKNWQVNQQYRDQVKLIQEKTGTSTPIIFVKADQMKAQACVYNIGIGPCRFAIMGINQVQFQNADPDCNMKVLAHETVHIDRSHSKSRHTILFAGVGLISLSPGLKLAQLLSAVPLRAGKTLAIGLALTTTGLLYPVDKKQHEHEADKGSFKKLNQLGYCKILEDRSQYYKIVYECYGPYNLEAVKYNPDLLNYPPYNQLHEWADEECIKCRQNEKNNH